MSGRKLRHSLQMLRRSHLIRMIPCPGTAEKRAFRIASVIVPVSGRIAVRHDFQAEFAFIVNAFLIFSVPQKGVIFPCGNRPKFFGPDRFPVSSNQIQDRVRGFAVLAQRDFHFIFTTDKITAVACFCQQMQHIYRHFLHPYPDAHRLLIGSVGTRNISNPYFFWRQIKRDLIAGPPSPFCAANVRVLDFIRNNRVFCKGKQDGRLPFQRYRRDARAISLIHNYPALIFCFSDRCRNHCLPFADSCYDSRGTDFCHFFIARRPFNRPRGAAYFQRCFSQCRLSRLSDSALQQPASAYYARCRAKPLTARTLR